MSATAERSTNSRTRMTRAEAAEALEKLLTDEPQSAAALRRKLFGNNAPSNRDDSVRSGLGVLEAQHRAKRIPRQGWTRMESAHDAEQVKPQQVVFPYEPAKIRGILMFVDRDYQRPLTSFVNRIVSGFDPLLFQPLSLSDRGTKANPRYAIMDGQTRWVAAYQKLGIQLLPANVYTDLSPEEEADIFSRLQTQRKGMLSWHRFRADLRAKKPMAIAIKDMTEMIGYTLGDGTGELRSVAALEAVYKQDPFLLERTLMDFKEAIPDAIPEAAHIRGLSYFFRHFPIGERKREEINDARLIRRLRASGVNGLERKKAAAKEFDPRATNAKLMATAIQNAYLSGGKSG